MTLIAFTGAVELGLIYSMVAVGLYLSYKILGLADLTVDGSFTLGAAVSIMAVLRGYPALGLIMAALCGAVAGLVTAFLQTKLGIQPILAGILTMTALYSINLKVMDGKASINALSQSTIFSFFQNIVTNGGKLILILALLLAVTAVFVWFMGTQFGMAIRATGDNESMVRSSSIDSSLTKTVGLMFANALVAFSGGLLAQYQKSADTSMGAGVVVIGLASVIIGDVIVGNILFAVTKKRNTITGVVSVICGSILYRLIIAFVLQHNNHPDLKFLNITASDMKLLSSIIVVIAISYPVIKQKLTLWSQKRRLKNASDS